VTTPSHLIDIMPTCVQVAAASYPSTFDGHQIEPMEGTSLIPAFHGKPLSRTSPIFWEHEGNKAVRDGRWKLVMRHKEAWQLFDMETDRTEQHDLSGTNPEAVQRLQFAWSQWAERTHVDDWNGPDHTDWVTDIPKTTR
jgi:arylsulfatase